MNRIIRSRQALVPLLFTAGVSGVLFVGWTVLFVRAEAAAMADNSISPRHCSTCTLESTASTTLVANFVPGILFDTTGFVRRWQCGDFSPVHGWTHIIADFSIFAAYMAIPAAIAFFILRRRDVPFPPIFWLFAIFVLSCGIGHLIEGLIFWQPWYRLSAAVKVCTAIVSWATVLALLPVLPKALSLPGLATVNKLLLAEVAERRVAEKKLQQSYDELSDFSSNAMGREERMISLKHEVDALLQELGRQPRYTTDGANK